MAEIRKTCSFVGDNNVELSMDKKRKLENIIENLINNGNVGKFLFGNNGDFNNTCCEIITNLKEKFPNIITKIYNIKTERIEKVIDCSDYCIFYYDKDYVPTVKKSMQNKVSGTKKAYEYAVKSKKKIINVFNV